MKKTHCKRESRHLEGSNRGSARRGGGPEAPAKVAYGQEQVALLAKEMRILLKDSKKQFWH